MDVHVPAAVTRGLLLRNIGCAYCPARWYNATRRFRPVRSGEPTESNADLFDRVSQLNRTLASQDEDMLAEAARRQRDGIPFTGLVYAHQLHITIGRFISDLELLASAGEPEDFDGRVEFLPL
jgi:hypothetical protein